MTLLRRPTAFVPVAMSVTALLTAIVFAARFGTAPQRDKGAAAHLWQVLMLGQAPIISIFIMKWLTVDPKQAVVVLSLQVAAGIAALAPVWWFGW